MHVRPPRLHRHFRSMVFPWVTLALVAMTGLGAAGAQSPDPTPSPPPAIDHGHTHGGGTAAPSAADTAAAAELLATTTAATSRFADPAVALAEGYAQVTPYSFHGLRAAHFYNPAYDDDHLLDPARPEVVIYAKNAANAIVLAGVMFIASPGTGPQPAGELTVWHEHHDVCISPNPAAIIPTNPTGICPTASFPLDIEMLHVWRVDDPAVAFVEAPAVADLPEVTAVPGSALFAGTGGTISATAASLINWEQVTVDLGDLLDLTPKVIQDRFIAGESFAEIGASQGVPRDDIEGIIARRLAADSREAVDLGDMTTGQRDLMLVHLADQIDRLLDIHHGEPWLLTAP